MEGNALSEKRKRQGEMKYTLQEGNIVLIQNFGRIEFKSMRMTYPSVVTLVAI